MTDKEIVNIVEPLMDNCSQGSSEGIHTKHVRDFTNTLKSILTPNNLADQLKR